MWIKATPEKPFLLIFVYKLQHNFISFKQTFLQTLEDYYIHFAIWGLQNI